LTTVLVVAAAACAVISVWIGSVAVAVLLAAVIGVAARRATLALLVVVIGIAAVLRADAAWQALAPDELGRFSGWASVVAEARPFGNATRVLVEMDGERFELWVRGRAARGRVATWRGGDLVIVTGERVALDASRARRVAWEHVVGELELDWMGDVAAAGRPLDRASNRVRRLVEGGAAHLPAADGALLRGLVIGDDRDQPPAMIERFRASGLSHLTAVSGQNVAFVLAAAGPLLRRARPLPRLVVTLALVGWFVALTRFEPSIVRAGAMAGLASVAFALGHDRAPVRLLAVAVTGLVLIDPLLVWSIGFWLSVGATAGVTTIGPWLAPRLTALGWMAAPIAVTVGAQIGVALPSLLVFGRLPLVGTVANLVAVPVAGAVMMYGLPACVLAGAVPAVAPVVVFPLRAGVRWIDTVAALGAALEPPEPWPAIGWAGVLAALTVTWACRRRRDRLRR
jgi:competence protein ComEC